MKRFVLLTAGSGLFATLAMAQVNPGYRVIDLGTLGGQYSFAYGVNNAGWVGGGAATQTQIDGVSQTAVAWFGGQPINLGTLGGTACPGCNSEADTVNMSGEVSLLSETATMDPNGEDFCGFGTHRQCLAAIWENGPLKALSTLPGGNNAQAYWLNNRGEVIGFSEVGIRDTTCATPFQVMRFMAVKWGSDGQIHALPPLEGDTVSFGFGINNKGQAIGVSGVCSNVGLPPNGPGGPHAVLWDRNGAPTDLGTLPGAVGNYAASGINDRGEVVGNAKMADGGIRPFLWTKQTGMLALTPNSDPVNIIPCCGTINNRGEMVGFSCPGPMGNCRAIVWFEADQAPVDLNTLIPAGSAWYLLNTASINDSGEIVGYGTFNGESHAFLAKPVTGSPAA